MKKFFTSESVTEGHPDKVCDRISDGILDAILTQDPMARTAIECCAAYDLLLIMGEVTTSAKVDYERTAREVIQKIGYNFGTFSFDKCKVIVAVHEQSPDIAMGVDASYEKKSKKDAGSEEDTLGAGDQGMMFGYACRETESLMPLPIELAHALAKRLELVRRIGELPYLLPDGKTQVTVEYRNGAPSRIATVVVSAQHLSDIDISDLRSDLITHVIIPTLPGEMTDEDTQYFINPTGRFVIGGPAGDSGLTGRKLIADTYGGYARHGGGAFSGKDATKVDRSGAYMARYIAKNVVAAGLAERCEVQLSYSIGLAEPISVRIDTFGTEKVPRHDILDAVLRTVDLRPAAIIRKFELTKPIYSQISCYGHFGSNATRMPWEQTDIAGELQKECFS